MTAIESIHYFRHGYRDSFRWLEILYQGCVELSMEQRRILESTWRVGKLGTYFTFPEEEVCIDQISEEESTEGVRVREGEDDAVVDSDKQYDEIRDKTSWNGLCYLG